jgi:hypothetical protein
MSIKVFRKIGWSSIPSKSIKVRQNDHIIFNVGTLSLEARNIRLVNIITYTIEEYSRQTSSTKMSKCNWTNELVNDLIDLVEEIEVI